MSDLVARIRLDDSEFRAGLGRVKDEARASTGAIGAAAQTAGAALKGFAEPFEAASRGAAKLAGLVALPAAAMGAMIGALGAVQSGFAAVADMAYKSADQTGRLGEAIREARAGAAELSRSMDIGGLSEAERSIVRVREEFGRLRAAVAEGANKEGFWGRQFDFSADERRDAVRRELESLEMQESLALRRLQDQAIARANAEREQQRLNDLSRESRDLAAATASFLRQDEEVRARIVREADELAARQRSLYGGEYASDAQALDANLKAIRAAADARLAALDKEEARRASMEADRRRFDSMSLDVEEMRAKGLDREADAAQIRLDIERRIAALRDDQGLSDDAKSAAEARLRGLESLRLDALARRGETYVQSAAGVSELAMYQTLGLAPRGSAVGGGSGGAAGGGIAQQSLQSQQRVAATAEQIAEFLERMLGLSRDTLTVIRGGIVARAG